MLIPVFVSSPTSLNEQQSASRQIILRTLKKHGLEARAIGKTDYPTSFPLREVYSLARHCSGGVILGFSQFEATSGVWKKGTVSEFDSTESTHFPTPWNHLEAGVLFSLNVPLLVFCECGVSGGVFDKGVTDLFVHPMPQRDQQRENTRALQGVFAKWTAKVRMKYYDEA